MSERLFCGDCGSPYKRATWNIHGRKQIVWRCVNRIEYGTKFCGSSPSIPEEELHRAILKAVQGLAANFTDEVAAQINGILHNIQTGESIKPMIAGIASVVIDVVFNYFLIYGKFGFPKLGVRGAAIATLMARVVEMLVVVIWTQCKKKEITFINGRLFCIHNCNIQFFFQHKITGFDRAELI